MKEWSEDDQPREKLLRKGKKELSNAELIAILIRSGIPGESALDVAKKILSDADNNLSKLSRFSTFELIKKHKGVGEAKAVSIVAALELGYRMLSEKHEVVDHYVTDSDALFKYIAPFMLDLNTEEFWAVYMNSRKKIIAHQRINKGGLNSTAVDIRCIMQKALELNAVCFAVAHNHPSGILKPSQQDNNLTARIKEAGKIMNIELIDHIIVGIKDNGEPAYYSYLAEGRI